MSDKVSLKDVYDAIGDLRQEINQSLKDHDTRIRRNENARIQMMTVAGVISFVVSFLGEEIKQRILGK